LVLVGDSSARFDAFTAHFLSILAEWLGTWPSDFSDMPARCCSHDLDNNASAKGGSQVRYEPQVTVGVVTDAALDGAFPAATFASPVTGETVSLAAEGTLVTEGAAGPIGWIKLGMDFAIFATSAAYCATHP
jgi:hypothetical protein